LGWSLTINEEKILFVGDRRSELATRMGVYWEDERLSGKRIFETQRKFGMEPHRCRYVNLNDGPGEEVAREYVRGGGKVIAMGQKVADGLTKLKIPHIAIPHPAARGELRREPVYVARVRRIFVREGLLRIDKTT